MKTNAGGLHSVVPDTSMLRSSLVPFNYSGSVDRQGQNVVTGFSLPLTLGEALHNSDCGQMPINPAAASSVEIWNVHPGRDAVEDYTVGTSYPSVRNIQSPEQFMEGIPISGAAAHHTLSVARYGTFEDQQKPTTLDSCAYPLEYPNSTVPNHSSDVVSSSFETINYGYEGSPFDPRNTWDFNKFTSQELLRRIVGRNGTEKSIPNEWILSENTASMDSSSPGASHSELCLSLSTCQRSVASGTSIRERFSEMSSVTSYPLHRKHVGSEQCSSNNPSLSFDSDKPLQLSLFSGSRFFQAMQEILAEIACYALLSYSPTCIDNGINVSFSSSCPSERGFSALDFSDGIDRWCGVISQNNFIQQGGVEDKKRLLLALLQVVDDQYNHCLDEVHTVISAFHAVTQLDTNIHARFALPTIASMYKNLRERISCHILEISANLTEECEARQEKSFEMSLVQKQWALQQLRKRDPQLWRPQRGLPERSVSVLRAWMFQNFLHPYPKDAEKHLLALKSGLTRSQVSNWFINARVRLWKPMIEEMYAEMNRRKTRRSDEESNGMHRRTGNLP